MKRFLERTLGLLLVMALWLVAWALMSLGFANGDAFSIFMGALVSLYGGGLLAFIIFKV